METVEKVANFLKEKISQIQFEALLNEATSNENWNPPTKVLNEIAELSFSHFEHETIMKFIWKRLTVKDKQWRRVLKTLNLVEYLLKNGSPRCINEFKDEIYTIRTLQDYFVIDDDNIDRGATIRDKSKYIIELLADSEKLQKERELQKNLKGRLTSAGFSSFTSSGRSSMTSGTTRLGSTYEGFGSNNLSQPINRYSTGSTGGQERYSIRSTGGLGSYDTYKGSRHDDYLKIKNNDVVDDYKPKSNNDNLINEDTELVEVVRPKELKLNTSKPLNLPQSTGFQQVQENNSTVKQEQPKEIDLLGELETTDQAQNQAPIKNLLSDEFFEQAPQVQFQSSNPGQFIQQQPIAFPQQQYQLYRGFNQLPQQFNAPIQNYQYPIYPNIHQTLPHSQMQIQKGNVFDQGNYNEYISGNSPQKQEFKFLSAAEADLVNLENLSIDKQPQTKSKTQNIINQKYINQPIGAINKQQMPLQQQNKNQQYQNYYQQNIGINPNIYPNVQMYKNQRLNG